MSRFSKEEDYAIILMATLAFFHDGKSFLSVRDIANGQHIPYLFLNKIAGSLKRAKVVKSKEGVGGGYMLAKEADKIKLSEIVNAVSGSKKMSACKSGKGCANCGSCPAEIVLGKIDDIIEKTMSKMTLQDVLHEYYKKSRK